MGKARTNTGSSEATTLQLGEHKKSFPKPGKFVMKTTMKAKTAMKANVEEEKKLPVKNPKKPMKKLVSKKPASNFQPPQEDEPMSWMRRSSSSCPKRTRRRLISDPG